MGNSLTFAQATLDTEWKNNCGMAATSLEKDYMHQTMRFLKEADREFYFKRAERRCSECGREIEEQLFHEKWNRRYDADHIVIQIMENYPEEEFLNGKFEEKYAKLLDGLTKGQRAKIYCLGSWGETDPKGSRAMSAMRVIQKFPTATYVDISSISSDSSNYGNTSIFQDKAILWHPGDKGMEKIGSTLAKIIMDSL